MKTFVLVCSLGAVLMSGTAYAESMPQRIDPNLIVLTGGDGLDSDASAQGNDTSGGMWAGALGGSSSLAAQRQATAVQSIPANRQWSHLRTRERHITHNAY